MNRLSQSAAPASQPGLAEAPPSPAAASGEPKVLAALETVLAKVEKAARLPDPVAMVHSARKAMKEYRGLLRLVPGERAKAARRATAAAARILSAARDRAAAQDALRHLADEGLAGEEDIAAARAAIGEDPAPGGESDDHRAELADFLAAARAQLADGLAAEAAGADVVAGLARAYRQARKARFDSPHHMHEARKRVVAHRYQMSFFAAAVAGRGRKRATRAQELRDLLGAYQDIETLRPMLEASATPLGPERLARLEQAMARLQRQLKRAATKLHRRLFRRRADAFAGRLRRAL
ncbi:CHAD domain-containing protein [Xanthobacter pseudotagetidis]|uniref:CHAD domain-containing protein n=1 Tax=Xanthobacter pseudotagetidis TaxID=3119911 RepID=UPI00372985C3